jgi:phage gp29-like protein
MAKNKINVTKGNAKEQPQVIVQTLTIRPQQRSNEDVAKWKAALQGADLGRRAPLLNLYENILLDPILTSLVEKRVLGITNCDWVFADENGKEVPEITALIESPAFETILEECQKAIFYGHSLLECGKNAEGELTVELIPRRNVKPELGIVVTQENNNTGDSFREPPHIMYCVEAGKPKDLGLLLKAAPFVIFKKGGFSDWAQYAELFGMPLRIGKYDVGDIAGKTALDESLDGIGSAGWMSIPKDTEIQIIEGKTGAGDGKLFETFKNSCNDELIILVLGQTMTTNNGASNAQGQVHLTVQDAINKKDERNIKRILNTRFKSVLDNLGYPVGNGKFDVKTENLLSTKERLEILNMVADKTPVADDEYYSTSGVPKPDNYDALIKEKQTAPVPPPAEPAPTENKKTGAKPTKKSNLNWQAFKDFFDTAQ